MKEEGKSYDSSVSSGALGTINQKLKAMDENQCGRSSLAEGLASRLHHAKQKEREVRQLERLVELLDKYPDLLEILNLIRDLGLI